MPSRIYSRSQHDLYWLNVVFAHLLFPLKRTNTGWEPTLSLSLLTVLLNLQYGMFISHCRCILMMYADSWARPTIVSRSGYKYTEPWFRQSKCNSYIAYCLIFYKSVQEQQCKICVCPQSLLFSQCCPTRKSFAIDCFLLFDCNQSSESKVSFLSSETFLGHFSDFSAEIHFAVAYAVVMVVFPLQLWQTNHCCLMLNTSLPICEHGNAATDTGFKNLGILWNTEWKA